MTQKLDPITRIRIAQDYSDPITRPSFNAVAKRYGVKSETVRRVLHEFKRLSPDFEIRGREEQRNIVQPRKPRTSRRPR